MTKLDDHPGCDRTGRGIRLGGMQRIGRSRLFGLAVVAKTAVVVGGGEGKLIGSARRAISAVAQYVVAGGSSEVEADPHAFLYWPPTGLVVVPVRDLRGAAGVLVLRLSDSGFTGCRSARARRRWVVLPGVRCVVAVRVSACRWPR
jgi:hypothetical protein